GGPAPASPSSLTAPAIGHLADLAQSLAWDGAGLLTVLARIADPRCRRGIRHRLPVILGLAVCAALAGARSFTAIAGWAADADEATLAGPLPDPHRQRPARHGHPPQPRHQHPPPGRPRLHRCRPPLPR